MHYVQCILKEINVVFRFRDEYDDKQAAPSAPPASTGTGSEAVTVKPKTSLYNRPRPPPKIRRPVPLSERDKYAYKTSQVYI